MYKERKILVWCYNNKLWDIFPKSCGFRISHLSKHPRPFYNGSFITMSAIFRHIENDKWFCCIGSATDKRNQIYSWEYSSFVYSNESSMKDFWIVNLWPWLFMWYNWLAFHHTKCRSHPGQQGRITLATAVVNQANVDGN